MKQIILIAAFLALLGSVSLGADFKKGLAAYDSGDYATALREWKPLAEQGNADAQYNLGRVYREGRQDEKTAMKWYRLAAEQGYAAAQVDIGLMYVNGEGVSRDFKTAVKWYRLAAEQGDAFAALLLGASYADGKGVLQDYVYAHMWANIAAANGDEGGPWLRDGVAKKMTPAQIEKAQDLARECTRKKYKGC